MREIKFRAWDKTNKKMLYPDEQNAKEWRKSVILPDRGGSLSNGVLWESDRYPLMQFTGLKDKNGKEIYEGDIVNEIGMNKKLEVKFTPKEGWYPFSSHDNWEVIGNIYENPELLEIGI